MSPLPGFTHTTLNEVFSCISDYTGHLSGIVIVTPNHRLAAVLRQKFNHHQTSQGRVVWNTADILPFTAFIERTYTDALFASEPAAPLPYLLGDVQEQVLWEQIIRHSDATSPLLAVSETARLAREAWQLMHEWFLPGQVGSIAAGSSDSEDCRIFRDWAKRYRRITQEKKQTDQARLPDHVIRLWREQAADCRPQKLVCYGFDRITQQQHTLFLELAKLGCTLLQAGPEPYHGTVKRLVFAGKGDEIRHAAAWSRAQMEADGGTSRIGIVVPDLAGYRSDMVRLFGAVMQPHSQSALPGAQRESLPFNFSLGLPLTACPLVTTALVLLELAGKAINFEQISYLLRSPFLASSETAMADRARLDAQLRKSAAPAMTLEQLLVRIRRAGLSGSSDSGLVHALSALAGFHKAQLTRQQAPSRLAAFFPDMLKLTGFPGERTLDSAEQQTLAKWHEVITDFAGLDQVVPKISYTEAIAILRRMAAGVLFQPETPDVPVQILGVLEAAGMEFDHLWVMGLSDEVWPRPARVNPFLPLVWQRKLGVPGSSADEVVGFARRLTDGWLRGGSEVVLSHAQDGGQEGDRKLRPSPLIQAVEATDMAWSDAPAVAGISDTLHRNGQIEAIEDCRMPVLDQAVEAVRGGAGIITNYAACPFRAQAVHRLGAAGLESPHNGLNALERGILVHAMLAEVWSRLSNKSRLDSSPPGALAALLEEVAGMVIRTIHPDRLAILAEEFLQVEAQRLVRLSTEWLEHEKQRQDFSVIAIEDKRSIRIGGLVLQVKLDRVDESADGQRIVIDYKTGSPTARSMLDERPAEPQLPLYLVTAEQDAAAIAFAQIKAGKMRFIGYQRDRGLLPGVQSCVGTDSGDDSDHDIDCHATMWRRQTATWHDDLTRLAAGFVAGKAAVDPQRYPDTCRRCDLQPFCRIYGQTGSSVEENEDKEVASE